MKATRLSIPEVILFEPMVFKDDRGFFFESYNQQLFQTLTGSEINFVQDNHSQSTKGVLRGLHYQLSPVAQGKLVRVTQGEIFDVAVDLRKDSPTFGQYVYAILSAENKNQLWIPEGFAHGFLTLSDMADVLYKTTAFYNKEYDRSVRWDDAALAIRWPQTGAVLLSEKDKCAPFFKDATGFSGLPIL